jgi:hypothetical protein
MRKLLRSALCGAFLLVAAHAQITTPGGGGSGTPGGSNTQFQYNNSSAFGGMAESAYSSANGTMTWTQKANGNNAVIVKRFTDTTPTGCLIQLQTAAGAALNTCTLDTANNLSVNSLSFQGTFSLLGATSGTVSVQAPSVALGSYTITQTCDPHDPSMSCDFDDFGSGNATSGQIGKLGWERINIAGTLTPGHIDSVYPQLGIVRLTPSNTATNGGIFTYGSDAGGSLSPFGDMGTNTNWDIVWRWRINATTVIRFRIGVCNDTTAAAEGSDFIGVRYDTNVAYADTAYNLILRSSSTNRAAASGTATATVDTGWHKLRIRSTTAGTIIQNFDTGGDVTWNANAPTANMMPCVILVDDDTAGVNPTADVDYFRYMFTGLSR